jgi:hypothetical protein
MSLEILSSPKTWTNLYANSLTAQGITCGGNGFSQGLTLALIAHAGGGQAGAVLCPSNINIITAVATANDSVILPLMTAALSGTTVVVFNSAGNAANVFPAVGQQINVLGVNVAANVAANRKGTFFWDGGDWRWDTIS